MESIVAYRIGSYKHKNTASLQLPKPGGSVKGVTYGVPFTGKLREARFHSYNGDLLVSVDYDAEIVIFDIPRKSGLVTIYEDYTDKSEDWVEAS